MPYIDKTLRWEVDLLIQQLCDKILRTPLPDNVGLMNYVITRIVSVEMRQNLRYRTINEAIGVLECCKLELYRRLAANYEGQKLEENGDVF